MVFGRHLVFDACQIGLLQVFAGLAEMGIGACLKNIEHLDSPEAADKEADSGTDVIEAEAVFSVLRRFDLLGVGYKRMDLSDRFAH
jgi:hypothetical protein